MQKKRRLSAFAYLPQPTVALWPSWPFIAAPSVSDAPTDGMVVTVVPSVPATGPATLLYTTAPTPPLFWQLVTLVAKSTVPRWIRQTLPETAHG